MRQRYRTLLKLFVVLSLTFLLCPSNGRAEFYWHSAYFNPAGTGADNAYDMSKTGLIYYNLFLGDALVGDTFKWSWYNPVIDPDTGLPTNEMELYTYIPPRWGYAGSYWWFWAWPYSSTLYTSDDSLWLGTAIYVNGYSPSHYPGKWRVDVSRTTGGVETVLTSGYFTLRDDIKPSVSFVSPTNGATLTGRQDVTILAYDNVKVTSVDLYAKNKETGNMYFLNTISSVGRDGYWHYTWSSGSYPLGNYILIAQANDPYGNIGEKSIEVMSYPEVAVVSMSATNDIDLSGVTDPVFTAQFVPSGSGADLTTVENETISALINSSFDLNVAVGAFPGRPTWTPVIEWKYSLLGNSQSGSFTGWNGTIPISTAVSRVSDRTFQDKDLKLTFIIKDPNTGQTIRRQTESIVFKPGKPEIKLEKVGEILVEKANNYSENSTIRLTTVYPNGHPLAGQMYIANYDVTVVLTELPVADGTVAYGDDGISSNGVAGFYDASSGILLPNNTVNIVTGYVDFIAKSLKKTNGITVPVEGIIGIIGYNTYGDTPLTIPQWVDIAPVNGTVDWFEQRVQDTGLGDCATFDDDYYNVLMPASAVVILKTTRVSFNKRIPEFRLNESVSEAYFENNLYSANSWLTTTIIHESRHCWQGIIMLRNDLGQDDDFDLVEDPSNDDDPRWWGDGDYLPEVITRPDAYRILDNTANTAINPNGFKGDSEPDDDFDAKTITDPQTAIETDAYAYAPHTSIWPLP